MVKADTEIEKAEQLIDDGNDDILGDICGGTMLICQVISCWNGNNHILDTKLVSYYVL